MTQFSGSVTFAAVVAAVATVVFTAYALRAMKTVFGGGRPATIARAFGVGVLYLVVAGPAFFIVLIWASLV